MEVFAPLEVQDPTALAPTAISISADAAVKEAEANRPEIAKAVADVQSTTAALALVYAGSGLQVDVGLNGTYTILSTMAGSSNSVGWAVTATLTFPVLDGGRAEAAIKEAQANLRAAESKAESVRLTIRQDAYQAFLAAVQARANLEATQAAQAAAAAALQAAEGRYRAGVGTILEVTTARATSAQAEVNAITARYDQQAALATLRHALGRVIVGGTL
jgi:outer membrane protein